MSFCTAREKNHLQIIEDRDTMNWWSLFHLIVFPGLIFAATIGLLLLWLLRKLIARFQWRIGPPIYQCFADFFKLLFKESIVPAAANRIVFILASFVSLSAATVAMLLIPIGNSQPFQGFMGDIIVLIYLLSIPSIAIILGGSSSSNPFGAVGASRKMVLMIAYEIGLILSILTLVIDAGSLMIGDIVKYQVANQIYLIRYPFAAVAFFICVQAKLGITPFDIPDAKTELIAGPYTEYSGRLLALFKLSHAILFFGLMSLMISLFFPGPFTGVYIFDVLIHLLKCSIIVIPISIIAAVNPRLRIDRALRFFWLFVFILAAVDFARALLLVVA